VKRVLDEGKRIAEERRDPFLRAMLALAEGAAAYFRGEFAGAVEWFEKAERIFVDETHGTTYELATLRLMRLWAMRHLGDLDGLRASFGEYVRDAARRGDDYFETTLCRSTNLVWLAMDDAAAARSDLERKTWMPGSSAFSLQHWYKLRAQAEIDLYVGDHAAAAGRAAEGLEAMRRSLLQRIEVVRVECAWLSARLLVAYAATCGDAERSAALADASRRARALCGEAFPHAVTWGRLIEAAVAFQRDDRGGAREALSMAARGAEADRLSLVAAVARARLATVASSAGSSVADAEGAMRALGCANPQRMLDVYAPGFAKRTLALPERTR
jgi:hypothetical protein